MSTELGSVPTRQTHFMEMDNVLEEFAVMVKRVRGTLDDSGSGSGSAGSRASLAPIMEAEFNWATRHIYQLLSIGLSGYCGAHAEVLQEDADRCRQIVDAFQLQI